MRTWTRRKAAIACVLASLGTSACQFGGTDADGGQATLGGDTQGGSSGDNTIASTGNEVASGGMSGSTSSTDQPATSQGEDTCQSTCAPEPPAGWSGPRFLASGDPDTPPPCPVGYDEAAVAFAGLDAPPAECACSCKPDGGGCTMDYDFFTFQNCTIPLGPSGQVPPDTCEGLLISGALSGYVRGQIDAQAGSCEPESTNTITPPVWDTTYTLCTPQSLNGSCNDGICVPVAPADFGDGACISAEGDVDCPEGAYSERTVMYQGLLDDRTCSECVCNVASPPTCSGAIDIHGDNSCSETPETLPADGTCYDANQTGSFGLSFAATVGETVCEGSASVAQGEATRTNALTVCCAG